MQYRSEKHLNKGMQTSTQASGSRKFQCQTLWTQILPPTITKELTLPPNLHNSLKKNVVATVTPMVEKRCHKRPRTSSVPEVSSKNVPPACPLTPATTSSPYFDSSAVVAILLQKDIYDASFKKGSPRQLLASPISTKASESKISGLKIALFDVRQSRSKLERKCSGLEFFVCGLQQSNLGLKESYSELKKTNTSLSIACHGGVGYF